MRSWRTCCSIPTAAPAKVRAHVDACEHCRAELEELRATMALLDTWKGPEPSPYFMTRLDARLREQREAEPAGWFERLRARFVYGPQTHVRPLAAMALTVVLLLGGGAYLGITDWDQPANPPSRPPWSTICRRWITMPNCWTSWRRFPAATITGIRLRFLAGTGPGAGRQAVTGRLNAGRIRSGTRLDCGCLRSCACPRPGLAASALASPAPRSAGQAAHASAPRSQSTRNQPARPQNQSRPACMRGRPQGTQGSVRRPAIPQPGSIPGYPGSAYPRPGYPAAPYGCPGRHATPIPERPPATWATGSISTGVFPSRSRSGCCAATPASGALIRQTSSG